MKTDTFSATKTCNTWWINHTTTSNDVHGNVWNFGIFQTDTLITQQAEIEDFLSFVTFCLLDVAMDEPIKQKQTNKYFGW